MESRMKGKLHKIDTPSLFHTTKNDWQVVYEPAEDTFLMMDALEKDLDFIMYRKPRICLEVGSGSGLIMTALSKSFGSMTHCLATDMNHYACQLTKKTREYNNVNIDVIQGDLTSFMRAFVIDLIVFNPPYVVTTSEEVLKKTVSQLFNFVRMEGKVQQFTLTLKNGDVLSKSWAGGKNGREVIDRFLNSLHEVLDEKGFGYILLLKENDPQDVINILSGINFKAQSLAHRKIRGEELYVIKFEKM